MRVILDTNVILRAISSRSFFAVVLDFLYEEAYEIAFSNDILLEYEEKISEFYGKATAKSFLDFLVILPNSIKIEPYFHLNLISVDADDNKFVDCAFSSNAHYIVTDDKHFNILKGITFPTIGVLKADEFVKLLHSNIH